MTIQEKIRRYIERTGKRIPAAYQMSTYETIELRNLAEEAPIDALCLAFEYGQAKGVRAAQNGAVK